MKANAYVFSNEKITVTYNPNCCLCSERCVKELSQVFRATVIPWIDLDAANTLDIIEQVKKCPSGALKYVVHEEAATTEKAEVVLAY